MMRLQDSHMTERVFFNKFVTKEFGEIKKSGQERFFEGYLTVEMVDKQNEITIVDELMKVLPIWMSRGAPISDTHSNRIVGRGINFQKTSVTENGIEYPAIYIKGEIHQNYELDNEIWNNIQTGKYKGLSFGGATKSERVPITNDDGTTSYALKDLEHYEVAVCEDPAVPLALITHFNPIAKAMVKNHNGKYIQKNERDHTIRCYSFGCFVDKTSVDNSIDIPVSDKSFQDTKIVDDSPQAAGLPDKNGEKDKSEWADVDGVNRPQLDDKKVESNKAKDKPTSGKQNDPTGEDFEAVPHQAGNQAGVGMAQEAPDLSNFGIAKTENEAFKPNEELLGAAGKGDEKKFHDDEEDKDKTLNPGENMNMEKPIRGLRGAGSVGGGGGSPMMAGAKANAELEKSFTELKFKKLCTQEYLKEVRTILAKFDYDMRGIVNDPETNDPRKDSKKLAGPQLAANNGEDGKKNSITAMDDKPADAFAASEGTSAGAAKGDMMNYSGGTRGGSYENTDQGPQMWDARVSETGSNARDTKRIRSGEKDGLNTINTAAKSLNDKLNAIEIRRSVKNL